MPCLRSPLIPALLLLTTLAHSHKPGQEYTYLSMFVKPQTPDMIEGDNHLGEVYEQLSVHRNRPNRRRTRLPVPLSVKIHQPEPQPNTEKHHSYSQSDRYDKPQHLSRIPLNDRASASPTVPDSSDEDADDDEDEDEDDVEDEDTKLQREPLPASATNIHVHQEQDADKEDTTVDKDLAEQMAHKYGENLDRIQAMLLKIIRKYDIGSMADIPCRAHAHWMPLFLEKLSEEKLSFKYYCVDTSKEVLKSVKESITKPRTSKFVLRRFWQEGIPRADLVFSWAGLDNMQPENVVKYLDRLSKTGDKHKIIAIGTHTGWLKKQGSKTMIARFTAGGAPINVREPPFKLQRPMRIISDLSTQGNDKKLYLYKADDMVY